MVQGFFMCINGLLGTAKVLMTKLDEATVYKIINAANYQKDYTSYIWEDDLEGGGYTIWVRCLRNTGIMNIDLIKR